MIYTLAVIAAILIVAAFVVSIRHKRKSKVSKSTQLESIEVDPWIVFRRDESWEASQLSENADYEMLFPQEEIPRWTL